MRIRDPRRILVLGIVLALLCALPAVIPSSVDAKPYNWDKDPDDPDNPGPKPPSGDGDGTIVKARSIDVPTTYEASSTTTRVTRQRTWSIVRTYLSMVRWGFGLRWGGF
jgi:hypothetical protein